MRIKFDPWWVLGDAKTLECMIHLLLVYLDKCNLNLPTVQLYITSLNSHFPHQETQHKILKSKIAEPGTPHFLSLNQDIVGWSLEEKCGLKYGM